MDAKTREQVRRICSDIADLHLSQNDTVTLCIALMADLVRECLEYHGDSIDECKDRLDHFPDSVWRTVETLQKLKPLDRGLH